MILQTLKFTFPAAFSLLPYRMDTQPARALLLAIGLQESGFRHRRQVRGPARGLWQFEKGGGVRGVLRHNATATYAEEACRNLLYTTDDVYDALSDNDVLAAVFARLLLWSHPDPIPGEGQLHEAWKYYLDTWRPGKPHRDRWLANFNIAWSMVK